MPRSKEVTVAGKKIIVPERKIKELKALAAEVVESVEGVFGANTPAEIKDAGIKLLNEKIPELFPPLTAEDIDEAFPSEIEALGEAFLELNFFSLKKIIPTLLTLIQAGLKGRMM